jgi:geranylgeranylglycerol-phosphate geranylgeranyltransferase
MAINSSEKVETSEEEVSIWTYMGRGLFYAITSGLALTAGYLIQPKPLTSNELLVLFIPLMPAIFFFMCYANKYHITDSEASPSGALRTKLQTQALGVFVVIAGLIIWIVLDRGLPPYRVSIAFGLYAILFIGYGLYLLRNVKKRELPLVRHQLVWPAVLSIAISFYYGLNYASLSHSLLPLLPIVVLLILFLLSEIAKFPKRAFVKLTLIAFFLISILTIIALIRESDVGREIATYFSSMLFSLSIAAYLAVFESWRVTAEIAQRPPESIHNSTGNLITPVAKAMQYVTSSLAFIAGCIWVLPIYFIFSQAGILFLFVFAGHAAVAFIFWFYTGTGRYLLVWPWVAIKLISGFLFLTLIVLATQANDSPTRHFVQTSLSIGIISVLFIFSGVSIKRLYSDFQSLFEKDKKTSVFRLFDDRINTARLLCLACWLTCVVIVIAEFFRETSSPVSYRAEYSLVVYGIFILICAVLELLDSLGLHKSMKVVISFLGLLQTIRIITSSVIAASVVLPCVVKGVPAFEAIGLSLPFWFAAMGGFALNDYFDVAKDRINKPHRALPSGRITPNAAIVVSVLFIMCSILAAFYVMKSNVALAFYLAAIIGILAYNLFVRYFAISKTFLTAGISGLPVFFDIHILQYPDLYLLVPMSTMLFLLGRELLMDVTDIEGDRYSGITTIPMLLGQPLTTVLSFLFQIIGASLLVPIILNAPLISNTIYLGLIFTSIIVASILWHYNAGNYQKRIIMGLWVPMTFGILILVG